MSEAARVKRVGVLLLLSMQSPELAAILKGVQDTGPVDQDLSFLIGFGVGP